MTTFVLLISYLVYLPIVYFFNKATFYGSDHFVHLSFIRKIRLNGHRFRPSGFTIYNERNTYYPQLFHWILSFLPKSVYENKPHIISTFVTLIEIAALNIYLLGIKQYDWISDSQIIYVNVIFNLFPFSYVLWNSKNSGISARGMGLFLGHIFFYLISFYFLTNNPVYLAFTSICLFIIIITSQFAAQFAAFSILVISIIFKAPEIIIPLAVAYAGFAIIFPKVARSYFIGQFNHKRNYALYVSPIHLFRSRSSIYQDFVLDFWVYFRNNSLLKSLNYVLTNPIVELLYGMPYLWFCIWEYMHPMSTVHNLILIDILMKCVFACLVLFFLTSFKISRFLGEPQRYMEFSFPFIAICFVLLFSPDILVPVSICCLLAIVLYKFAFKIYYNKGTAKSTSNMSSQIVSTIPLSELCNNVVMSNDYTLLRHLCAAGFEILQLDTSDWIGSKEEYMANYYANSLEVYSPEFLIQLHHQFKPNVFLFNKKLYPFNEFRIKLPEFDQYYSLLKEMNEVLVYIKSAN